jgi:hypothetical protein
MYGSRYDKAQKESTVTVIPWATLESGQVETIAAVLLGRVRPRSFRVRPDRGDKGVDVCDPVDERLDVFQVKSFATALNASRKAQVRRSLQRVVDAQVPVRDWYLTLPLNASWSDRDFLAELQASVTFSCHWFGLDQLESLAAAHQDVVDYYIYDGRQRLEGMIDRLRGLAGLVGPGEGQLVTPAEATDSLDSLYRALNSTDPHFRYEFEVGAELGPISDRPGLVASHGVSRHGVSVTHHVIARYDAATEDRPIPLALEIRPDQMDPDLRRAWERAVQFGTPVELAAPGVVTRFEVDLPGGLAGSGSDAIVKIGPSYASAAREYRLRLQVVNPDGGVLNEVVLDMEPVTTGHRGGSWRAHGHAPGDAFELELLGTAASDGSFDGSLSISAGSWSGASPSLVCPAVQFLGQLRAPNSLRIAPEFGPPSGDLFGVVSEDPIATDEGVALIEALAELQMRLDPDLVVPDLDRLTRSDYLAITRAGRLLRGEVVREEWSSHTVTMTLSGPLPPTDGPCQIAISGTQSLQIGGCTLTLEPVTMVFLAATLSEAGGDAGESVEVHLTPALGNSSMIVTMAPIDAVPPQPLDAGHESEAS